MANKVMNLVFCKTDETKKLVMAYLKDCSEIEHVEELTDNVLKFKSRWQYPLKAYEKLAEDYPELSIKASYSEEFYGSSYNGNLFISGGIVDDREIAESYRNRFTKRVWNY